jgi:hypothetical protein
MSDSTRRPGEFQWGASAREPLPVPPIPRISFKLWLEETDAHLDRYAGTGTLDYPLAPFHTWYDGGASSQHAALLAIGYDPPPTDDLSIPGGSV